MCSSCTLSLQKQAGGTTRVRQLGLPDGRAAWACQKVELPVLPAPCLQAALREVLLELMGDHGPCPAKAMRTVVFLLARYHSLQSIHQEKGSIRSTITFGIGRTIWHAGNVKGEIRGNWVLRTGREVSDRGQALGRWS